MNDLKDILANHLLWLKNEGGARANLIGADLRDANLYGANLLEADLSGVKLNRTIGDMVRAKTLLLDTYIVTYTHNMMFIGCESHLISDWKDFSDEYIDAMDTNALVFWVKYKELIFKCIELSPAI